MLKKNIEKNERKNRDTWVGYHQRVTKNKKKYNRKSQKRLDKKEFM